ncbi:hypothetical protein QTP70_011292 [Hemibagrus guttatus]|uniref:Uncharacterized protein n=1 Tax=Hemibagrus guttatus TaxID=175788 RepID=A0AAE0RAR2_9TELE|nr:hypothetical protein QTP70_011292 [Hemibagrus guttatus]
MREACEDTFELHSVDLELEAVEKQIHDLQVKQPQLRQRKAMLESSRTDDHLSQVSFTPAPGYHGAWMQQQRKTRARPRARTSTPPPPPVFEILTRNHFAPLPETECDVVIIGDSISMSVPAILKKNIGAVVLHAGMNDTRLRQTETLVEKDSTPDDRQTRGMKVGVLIVIEDDDPPYHFAQCHKLCRLLEEVIVLQDAPDLKSAVAYLFGLLFALDFQYPKNLKYTFEVIEKVFVEMGTHCSARITMFEKGLNALNGNVLAILQPV